MADDWIKIRHELWTHPRFIAVYKALIYDDEQGADGLLGYVCGEALGVGVMPPSNKSVTERALRLVTERALRDVTMCALQRVWCSVNSHCRVVGLDAVCSPMQLNDLDDIAGFCGFGEALEIAGWAKEDKSEDAVIFKNFTEFNEPACLRKKPKSNAERQAEHRQRQRELGKGKKVVTKSNESNAREEKRRVDIDLTKVRSKKAASQPEVDYPAALNDWIIYRVQIRKPLKIASLNAILKKYENKEADLRRDVDHSIAQGYQGLFAPGGSGNGFKTAKEREREEAEARSSEALKIWGINPEDVP